MFYRLCCVVLLGTAVVGAPRGTAWESGEGVSRWWLESGPKLIALDDRAAKLAEIDAGENVVSVAEAFGRIVVASTGAVTRNTTFGGTRELWPVAGSSSKITVLDGATLSVVASRTIPFNPSWVRFVNAETLVVISTGQVSGDPKKEILPAVTVLRAPKWEAGPTIPLKTPPILAWSEAGSTDVHIACETFKQRPAEMLVVDAAAGEARRTALTEDVFGMARGSDGRPAYLVLEKSIVPLDPQGGMQTPIPPPGKTRVLFARMPGSATYLLGASSGKTGTLQIVKDGKVARTIELADGLERAVFGPRTHRLYVCGRKVARVLDTETWDEVGKLTIPENLDGQLDTAERRLFFFEAKALSIVDVDGKLPAGRVGFGGGFAQLMMESTVHWEPGEAGALLTNPSNEVVTAVPRLVIAPSGSHALVYNVVVNQVSLIDTASLAVDVKLGLSSALTNRVSDLWRLPGGGRVLAVRGRRLVLFDLEKGAVAVDKEIEGRVGWMSLSGLLFVRAPGGTTALSLDTLQPVQDFGPEAGVPEETLKDDLGIATHALGRRFVITTSAGVKLYDFDFKHLGTVEGIKRIDGFFRTGPAESRVEGEPRG